MKSVVGAVLLVAVVGCTGPQSSDSGRRPPVADTSVTRALPSPGFHLHIDKNHFEINGTKADLATLERQIDFCFMRVDSVAISILLTESANAQIPDDIWKLIKNPGIQLYTMEGRHLK